MTFATVLSNNYGAIENPNKNRSALDHIIEFNKKIPFRALQFLQRVSNAVHMVLAELGHSLSSFFKGLSDKLSTAWGFLTIPRLPEVTRNAWKAITTWGEVEGPQGYPMRANIQKVHDVSDFAASWMYAGSMVLDSTPLKNAGDGFNLMADVTDAVTAGEDIKEAGDHLNEIQNSTNEALKERFAETKKEAMLRLAKAVASVVSGALGLLVLFYGGPVLPAAVLLAISMTSTVFAMAAHFYRETRNYETVKFFEWRSPGLVDGLRVN